MEEELIEATTGENLATTRDKNETKISVHEYSRGLGQHFVSLFAKQNRAGYLDNYKMELRNCWSFVFQPFLCPLSSASPFCFFTDYRGAIVSCCQVESFSEADSFGSMCLSTFFVLISIRLLLAQPNNSGAPSGSKLLNLCILDSAIKRIALKDVACGSANRVTSKGTTIGNPVLKVKSPVVKDNCNPGSEVVGSEYDSCYHQRTKCLNHSC